MKDELIERLRSSAKAFRENTVYDSEGDPLRLIVQADECDEAAAAGAADNARVDAALAFLDDIKQEALTAGSPGHRTSAKAFSHIVRLCIDARALLKETSDAK